MQLIIVYIIRGLTEIPTYSADMLPDSFQIRHRLDYRAPNRESLDQKLPSLVTYTEKTPEKKNRANTRLPETIQISNNKQPR